MPKRGYFFAMDLFLDKKYRIAFAILAVAAILIAIGFGGWERWVAFNLDANTELSEEQLKAWESQMDKASNALVLKYNLGCYYYQNGLYEKAARMYQDIIDSSKGGTQLQKSTFYNLGNTTFRMAETIEDIEQALSLYRQSLMHYRGGIEKEEQERKFLDKAVVTDPDIQHNYALTLKRIKILSDQLRQQQKESTDPRELFQLLKEIQKQEAGILSRLSRLAQSEDSEKSQQMKEALLQKREKNLDRLKILKEKILRLFSKSGQPPSKATHKSVQPI